MMDSTQLLEAIAGGTVSAAEACEAAIARIEAMRAVSGSGVLAGPIRWAPAAFSIRLTCWQQWSDRGRQSPSPPPTIWSNSDANRRLSSSAASRLASSA